MNRMILFVFLGVFLMSMGCGKKDPPFLPKKEFPLEVVDLKADWVNSYIFLKGKIRGPDGFIGPEKAVGLIKGSRVYYAKYPLKDPPCAGCPIEYHGHHGFGPEVIAKEGFFCRVPGKMRGQIYFFKVHLIGQDETVGPPSLKIRVEVK
ncbi:MAG: hypothetical protein SV375_02175 [Thermodesulfobacteriota bacterium]|nr:hypothetical protein [Thermodesulfobacteriota bacterium]